MFQRFGVQIPAPYTGWTFCHIPICCKICSVFEKTVINEKRPGLAHFKKL